MWIEQTSNGRFKYVERYEDYRSGKLKRVSVTFDNKTRETQKKAKLLLEEKIAKILSESKLTIKDMNLFDAIDEWLEVYEQQVEDTTYNMAEYFRDKSTEYFSKDILISRMHDADWNNFLEDLLYNKKLANGTVRGIKGKLTVFIRYCKQKGYVEKEKFKEISFTNKKEEKEKIENKFLEDDEYKLVIENCENIRYRNLFEWMYLTGMRIGEVLALRKSDIHITPERAYASVTGTTDLQGKRKERTKTKAGTREVDLSKKAVDVYNEMCEISPDSEMLFVNRNNTLLLRQNVNTYLRTLRKKIEFNKKLYPHMFRHTHISKLAELGVPLHAIKERVGHESSDITEKIYLHVTKNVRKSMVEKLDKL